MSGSVTGHASPPGPPRSESSPPGPSRRTQPGRVVLTVLAVALMVAGLGSLGWVGYELVGSNLVADHAYRQEKAELRDRWAAEGAVSERGGRATEPAGTDAASRIPGQAIALLRIPAFGADYEVPVLEGTELYDLGRGVGRYATSALPGQVGNLALAGHRITHGQPFSRLLELDRGDEVIVETRDAVYTYVIDAPPRDLTVTSTAGWVLDPVPGQPRAQPTGALLTLTTCTDLFRSPDRSVGFGHLVSTKTKG